MNIKNQIMRKSREKKFTLFLDFINKVSSVDESTILDVGVNTTEHSPVDNYLEKHYPYLSNITALSVTPNEDFSSKYPSVKFVKYDGKLFPFADKEFDFIHSNAVIEHVGGLDSQKLFCREMLRVAKRGVFFTTPNKYFPIEMHTNILLLHYLPKYYFDKFLVTINKAWATGDYMFLLSSNNLKQIIKQVCPDNYDFKIKRGRLLGFTYQLICTIRK